MKKNKIALPDKKTMNLYIVETTNNSLSRVLPVALIILIVSSLLVYFGVIKRLAEVNELRSTYNGVLQEYNAKNTELEDYNTIKENYRRYFGHYQNDNKVAIVDRLLILSILQDATKNYGSLMSINIIDNKVTVIVQSDDLSDIGIIKQNLENNVHVITANVYSADTTGGSKQKVQASIVFSVQEVE